MPSFVLKNIRAILQTLHLLCLRLLIRSSIELYTTSYVANFSKRPYVGMGTIYYTIACVFPKKKITRI